MPSHRPRAVRRIWLQALVASGCVVTGSACSDYSAGASAGAGQPTQVDTSLPSGAGGADTGTSGAGGRSGASLDAGTNGGGAATEGTPQVSGGLENAGGATASPLGNPGELGDACPPGDRDLDQTPDCLDRCPADYIKTEPGVCGCSVADTDTDGDGTMNCMEACIFDATRTTPGPCGCGAPDDLALCLRHRYSFDGTGATATDSAGDADGTIVNTTLSGDGTLALAGLETDQYVDLPDGIISALGSDATIEVWLTWPGTGAPWQRIFDFGSSEMAGLQGAGVTYLFITPSNTLNTHSRAAFTVATAAAERVVNGPTVLPFQVPLHLALVIDGSAAEMSLYQDGALVGTSPTLDSTLAALNDVNNWIGRSQFVLDEEFQGSIEEFRIYSAPRSAEQIAADVAAGPDELPEE